MKELRIELFLYRGSALAVNINKVLTEFRQSLCSFRSNCQPPLPNNFVG